MAGWSLDGNRVRALLAAAGPACAGAAIGAPFGLAQAATEAALLPAVIVGVAAATFPALYVGLSLFRCAPPTRELVAAGGRALGATGMLLLGLTPALLFLLLTADEPARVLALCAIPAVAISAVLGLRALFSSIVENWRQRLLLLPLTAVWSTVVLGLGAYFFLQPLWALLG